MISHECSGILVFTSAIQFKIDWSKIFEIIVSKPPNPLPYKIL